MHNRSTPCSSICTRTRELFDRSIEECTQSTPPKLRPTSGHSCRGAAYDIRAAAVHKKTTGKTCVAYAGTVPSTTIYVEARILSRYVRLPICVTVYRETICGLQTGWLETELEQSSGSLQVTGSTGARLAVIISKQKLTSFLDIVSLRRMFSICVVLYQKWCYSFFNMQ